MTDKWSFLRPVGETSFSHIQRILKGCFLGAKSVLCMLRGLTFPVWFLQPLVASIHPTLTVYSTKYPTFWSNTEQDDRWLEGFLDRGYLGWLFWKTQGYNGDHDDGNLRLIRCLEIFLHVLNYPPRRFYHSESCLQRNAFFTSVSAGLQPLWYSWPS